MSGIRQAGSRPDGRSDNRPMPSVRQQADMLKQMHAASLRNWVARQELRAMMSPNDARIALRLLPCEAYRMEITAARKAQNGIPESELRRTAAARWRRVVEWVDVSVARPDGRLLPGAEHVLGSLSSLKMFTPLSPDVAMFPQCGTALDQNDTDTKAKLQLLASLRAEGRLFLK